MKGIFGRILIIYAIVMAISFVFVEYYVAEVVKGSRISDLVGSMRVSASLIAEDIDFQAPYPQDELCRKFKRLTHERITLILPDGKVIGDSDSDSTSMENHIGRAEVQQAMAAGAGWSVRKSRTVHDEMLYTALMVDRAGFPEGFIRLAMPLTEVNTSISILKLKILFAVGMVLLISGGLLITQTLSLRRVARELSSFSESVARGEFERRLILEGSGEFTSIANNMNSMATELQRMITEHSDETERISAILHNIPDALLIIDDQGKIALTSQASREFFGIDMLLGRPVAEIVRAPEFFRTLDAARLERAPITSELVQSEPAERHMRLKISPLSFLKDSGHGFIVVFYDITEAKKLEQVRKDFVANVSHELKTPITAIKGFADTLLDGAIEDKDNARRFVGIIKANSERIDSLVDDLMTISKIELGAIAFEKASVDMEEIIQQVYATVEGRAREKGLALNIDVAAELHTVDADRGRLIQILTNLVDNALKFTSRGSITAGASMEGGVPFIFVRDTGMGIPARNISRLGERFYRVDPSRSRDMGGTGLGLAIVKHLVKAHGWTMRIESQEGVGTVVRILL